ncbi:putative periplasmic serine endoprotease DegP-like precursor [Methyloligella halotolerans]|uniref:Probable periplasmic serine endoprotease DegP-like n=1 Tax=Methyloligella halotolerans TaxID=1177755 RepID=A0A1E2S3K4_9HYPH|nr:Do family serine endopeptidase [Methyloligella halotolerans]ODA68982.1 putative periplasmic serine endoprotease DegP-like precursor [Methyloligella halotolerans]
MQIPSRLRLLSLKAAAAAGLAVAIASLPQSGSARGPESVADISEGLQETVVNISTTQTVKGIQEQDPQATPSPKDSPFEEFFDDFFDSPEGDGMPRRVSSLGSGFVYDSSGLIVTNNHVIEGADEIVVNFTDGRKLKVTEVLGHDPKTDLALLKVEPDHPLKAVTFGNSAKMRVGDWVMAIGNPFGLGGTLTLGIISATKRDINAGPYDDFIQTDAAINRGNSGGPLFNMDGEVIGVNTAIISPTGGSIGIGFAVPSNTALTIIDQLKQYGETRRGWLGVHVQRVTEEIAESLGMEETHGALVAKVMPGSPAEAAGIQSGDVILDFDGQEVDTMRSLPRLVAATTIGKAVTISLLRKREPMKLEVTVGRLPESEEVEDVSEAPAEERIEPERERVLGLAIAPLTAQLRDEYGIDNAVDGVIILEVEPGSQAEEKDVKVGDVIVEVTQETVNSPQEVLSRIDAVKKSGRKSVLLLISDGKGELSFVALPLS